MNDRTLLDIAKANLKAANCVLTQKTDDELFINIAAYHLQQTTELTIKHVLEINGVKYPKTHDISDLLDLVPEGINYFENISDLADTITMMESKTRYLKNYLSSEKKVMKVLDCITEVIKNIDNDTLCNKSSVFNK